MAACDSEPATQLVVWVRGDYSAAELTRIETSVEWPGSSSDTRSDNLVADEAALPFHFTVVPSDSAPGGTARISVIAELDSGRSIGATTLAQFLPKQTGVVELWLMKSCEAVPCPTGSSCHCGECNEVEVEQPTTGASDLSPPSDQPACGGIRVSEQPGDADSDAGDDAGEIESVDGSIADASTEAGGDAEAVPDGCDALLCFERGTFRRASPATYRTGARTIAVAAADELRFEDRADGFGAVALFEGQRTNLLEHYEVRPPTWQPLGGVGFGPDQGGTEQYCTGTAGELLLDAGEAPDGSQGATWVRACQAEWGRATAGTGSSGTIPYSGSFTHSHWFKPRDNPEPYYGGALLVMADSSAFNQEWRNYEATVSTEDEWTYVSASVRGVTDALLWTAYAHAGPNPTLADLGSKEFRGAWFWGHQFEQGAFPTTLIRSQGDATTREADILTFAAEDVPAALRSEGFELPVYPLFATGELEDDQRATLLSFGSATNSLSFVQENSELFLEAASTSGDPLRTPGLSVARHQQVIVSVHPETGELEAMVGGDTIRATGGQPWQWPAADLRIGGVLGANDEAFCRIRPPTAR